MSKFQIGERVKIKNYNDIPEEYQSKGIGRMCGEIGTILDIFYSKSYQCDLYVIRFENYEKSSKLWREEMLEVVKDVSYGYEIEVLDNIVLARLYETREDSKTEIARGHGHIIHEGAKGVAQATSYALKKIYFKVSDEEGEYGED